MCGLKPGNSNLPIARKSHTLRGCVDWNQLLAWQYRKTSSHPAWVCGLKHKRAKKASMRVKVTPCVGVWIETRSWTVSGEISESHPAWVCGLKLFGIHHRSTSLSHTLRGCVDWNRVKKNLCLLRRVTPCVGVWIETETMHQWHYQQVSHTLRGCVDWNIRS